mmetsp:Transcript_4373/g.11458  ORF Transcript_4373/g.11458 Transcript_4373/m.11458 type:complete len:234 (-) Transcript_4373:80-781(-)
MAAPSRPARPPGTWQAHWPSGPRLPGRSPWGRIPPRSSGWTRRSLCTAWRASPGWKRGPSCWSPPRGLWPPRRSRRTGSPGQRPLRWTARRASRSTAWPSRRPWSGPRVPGCRSGQTCGGGTRPLQGRAARTSPRTRARPPISQTRRSRTPPSNSPLPARTAEWPMPRVGSPRCRGSRRRMAAGHLVARCVSGQGPGSSRGPRQPASSESTAGSCPSRSSPRSPRGRTPHRRR